MKLITFGLSLISLLSSSGSLKFKQLTDHGLISENNYWCMFYLNCDVLPYKVCLIVANQTSWILSQVNNNLTEQSNDNNGGQLKSWRCKCCVIKGTNVLILRTLWFAAIKQLNELSTKDKDNPMLTIASLSTTESSQQSRTTIYNSVSIEITNNDDILINTTSTNDQYDKSTDLQSTITEETVSEKDSPTEPTTN